MAAIALMDKFMVQALWYVRKAGRVTGPFPAPQIAEGLRAGEILALDEVSLDGNQWEQVAESVFLKEPKPLPAERVDGVDEAWRAEREKARRRWRDDGPTPEAGAEVMATPILDTIRLQALDNDHETTSALIAARARRRPPWLVGLLALLVLGLLAVIVWRGQRNDLIQTPIHLTGDCAASVARGASWARCDKRASQLARAEMQSMNLLATRLDDANLNGANLSYANLASASLRNANLSGANLVGANLDGADLTGADLSQADLRYATFRGAHLEGTRLEGAMFGKTVWRDGGLCDRPGQCR